MALPMSPAAFLPFFLGLCCLLLHYHSLPGGDRSYPTLHQGSFPDYLINIFISHCFFELHPDKVHRLHVINTWINVFKPEGPLPSSFLGICRGKDPGPLHLPTACVLLHPWLGDPTFSAWLASRAGHPPPGAAG